MRENFFNKSTIKKTSQWFCCKLPNPLWTQFGMQANQSEHHLRINTKKTIFVSTISKYQQLLRVSRFLGYVDVNNVSGPISNSILFQYSNNSLKELN